MGKNNSLDSSCLEALLDSLDSMVYVADMDTYELLYLNHNMKAVFGELQGRRCWEVLQSAQTSPCSFCSNDKLVDKAGQPTGAYRWESQSTVNGRWYQCHDKAIRWNDGRIVRLEIATDITDKRKSDRLNDKTTSILQMIATGKPAEDIYNSIALMYEERHPGLRCSMLTLKGNKLLHGGAPSLPEEYCAAINGVENGPNVGSCGTSTYSGKRVLVEDIAIDPKWVPFKELALSHGLRSCWSEPIKDSTGKVMGAFGMYYNHPALPNEEELTDLESASRLAGIIMERERRETLLKTLSNSLEQSGEAVLITDPEGTIEYVNSAFSKLTGYSEADAVTRKPSLLKSEQQNDAFYETLWKTIISGKVWTGKVIQKRKDGSCYPAHLTISPVKNGVGDITHFVGLHSDLSDLQRLEEQLLQSQKMEAIGTLVGGIAHDFNNTLAGITGNLYLAKKEAAGLQNVTDMLLKVESLTSRATETIKQLLSFSRKGIVQKKSIPISPFLLEAIKLHQVSIPENINLHVDVQDSSMVISGDVNQLQQVLINLLNNACYAVAKVKDPCISIKIRSFCADSAWLEKHQDVKNTNFAYICISDNGCGIDMQHRQHIFEPFFTTKGVGQGTGLGLSMVYGAIKSHEGLIEVGTGEYDQGTSFNIYLPLLEMTAATLPAEKDTEVVSGNGETILLVDDNEVVLDVGKLLLEGLNYIVLTAKDGQEAVETYRASKDVIDLLVLDVVMPKMGGVEALRVIRQESPTVKAIFCTGYDKLNADDNASSEAVITKPFYVNELSQMLRSILD